MNSQNVGSTIHMLLSEGVGSFAVQWTYPFDIINPPPVPTIRQYRWWPDVDSDNDPLFPVPPLSDSDFETMRLAYPLAFYRFGIYFNIVGITPGLNWYRPAQALNSYITPPAAPLPQGGFPTALKFTFTLYDSKGVIKNGRTFTHIVYLD
jgi:hypothetical protein